MSWREKAAEIVARGAGEAPTEPTKPSNGGFVSTPPAPISHRDQAPAYERKGRALAYLEAHPEARRACFADVSSDPDYIILTISLREPWGALEMFVRRERFDALALMELSLRYPATAVYVPEH